MNWSVSVIMDPRFSRWVWFRDVISLGQPSESRTEFIRDISGFSISFHVCSSFLFT